MSSPDDRPAGLLPPTGLLRGASLFLDFDGTLVDLVPDPAAVAVGARLRALLSRLELFLDGRLAILSGRSLANLDTLLHPLTLATGGSHGLELRHASGARRSAERPCELDAAVSRLREVEAAFPGVLVEDKPLGVAIHFRAAPHAEEACRTAAHQAATGTGLQLQPGKMVFELKPGGDKGAALDALMAEPPFAGTVPLFLGDDLTDEPAFAAAQRLGGWGVLVGEARPTAARFRLPSVRETLAWLEAAANSLT